MAEAALTRPDTSDMASVHKVFRDALTRAPQLVGGVAPGDTERSANVGSFYANLLAFLHSHHEGEDDIIWPRLVERAPASAELVRRIAAQHDDVLSALTAAEEAVTSWTGTADLTAAGRAAAALAELNAVLAPHLDEEEQHIVPLAAEYLTAEEWGQLPGHSLGSFTGDKLWLVLGLVREAMTQDQRDHMQANMPPPVWEFWTTTGEGLFQDFITDLRR